jgi:hypothetical protein
MDLPFHLSLIPFVSQSGQYSRPVVSNAYDKGVPNNIRGKSSPAYYLENKVKNEYVLE